MSDTTTTAPSFSGAFRDAPYTREQLLLMDERTRKIAHQYFPRDTVSILAAKMIREAFGVDVFYYSEGKSNIDYDSHAIVVDGETKLRVSDAFLAKSAELTDLSDILRAARQLYRGFQKAYTGKSSAWGTLAPDEVAKMWVNHDGNFTTIRPT
jgi:hypothetical protein